IMKGRLSMRERLEVARGKFREYEGRLRQLEARLRQLEARLRIIQGQAQQAGGRARLRWKRLERELRGTLDTTLPPLHGPLRSVVVYVFLLVAFRLTGKRQVGQLTPFDLIVLLIISNVVQNALIGNDNSLGGGLVGAAAILALNTVVVEVTYHSRRARRLLEAQPTLLIHDGRLLEDNMRRERVT